MAQAKLRFTILGFSLILAILSVGSLGLAAQSQSAADDDDTLEQRLPPGIKIRAFIHRPRVVQHNHLGTCTTTNLILPLQTMKRPAGISQQQELPGN